VLNQLTHSSVAISKGLAAAPRSAAMDDLGLEESDHRLGEAGGDASSAGNLKGQPRASVRTGTRLEQ